MELNDPNRNRRVGFLGVAVATLLTPGGKLFTSAMAAVTLAVVGMNMAPKEDPSGLADSAIQTGALEASGDMLDMSDLPAAGDTQMLSAETLLSDPSTAPGNPAAFTSQTMHSANSAASNIAGMDVSDISGGTGPTVLPPSIFLPQRDKNPDPEKPRCTVILVEELASNTEFAGDEAICLEEDKLAEKNGDPESTGNPEQESVTEPVAEPIIIASGSPSKSGPELTTPEYIGPSPEETSPANSAPIVERQLFQPLISVAAVPEPTTLALFLLGLLGFTQIYRKKKNKYL